jgi:hypothetical protein
LEFLHEVVPADEDFHDPFLFYSFLTGKRHLYEVEKGAVVLWKTHDPVRAPRVGLEDGCGREEGRRGVEVEAARSAAVRRPRAEAWCGKAGKLI